MNTIVRFAVSGAIILVAGCQPATEQAGDGLPADVKASLVECTKCKWENVVEKDMKVKEIKCMNDQDQYQHCHLETSGYDPKRIARMTYDADTGAYSFAIVSLDDDHKDERMNCVNLAPDYDDDHIIRGTCIVNDDHEKPKVHYFKAEVRPRDDIKTEPMVQFYFRHRQYGLGREPVHNGEGHAHPDD